MGDYTNVHTDGGLKFIAHKKQTDEYTYVFEYWEDENYLVATGQEQWVDYISKMMTGTKVEVIDE